MNTNKTDYDAAWDGAAAANAEIEAIEDKYKAVETACQEAIDDADIARHNALARVFDAHKTDYAVLRHPDKTR